MTIKYQPDKFKDMPEPESILTISWEDVYCGFIDNDIEPTKDMIEKAFEFAIHNADNECLMDAFWENIKYAVDENSNMEDKE
jgi:hypothetical protein